jgi:hypothetical protein
MSCGAAMTWREQLYLSARNWPFRQMKAELLSSFVLIEGLNKRDGSDRVALQKKSRLHDIDESPSLNF